MELDLLLSIVMNHTTPPLFSLLVCCSSTRVVIISNEESGLWVKGRWGGGEESKESMSLLSIGIMAFTTHIILFLWILLLLLLDFPHCCCYCIWPMVKNISTFSWSSYHGHDSPFSFSFFFGCFFGGQGVVVVVVLLLVLPNKARILWSDSL